MPIVSPSAVSSLDPNGDFDRALDSIESYMKSEVAAKERERHQLVVTPEELHQIVAAAVTDAIAAYEKVRALKAEAVRNPPVLRLMPNVMRDSAPPAVLRPAQLDRLQDEMGLGEIEFEDAAPAPEPADLTAEMGIDGFAFEDAPGRPAQYPLPPNDQTVVAAMAEWDEALKRLSSEPVTADEPQEG
jgi:hypothetical protein